MIEGSELDATEIAKCAPVSDEIESQDTGSQKEDTSLNGDSESDETTEGDDGITTDQGSMEPPPKQKEEIADDILAEFENETKSTDDDKTIDLDDDFLSELNELTVKPDESCIDGEDDFLEELQNFDPEKLSE